MLEQTTQTTTSHIEKPAKQYNTKMGRSTETRLLRNPITFEEYTQGIWSEGLIHNKQSPPKEPENGNLSHIHLANSPQPPVKDTTEAAIILARVQFMATSLAVVYFQWTSQFELRTLKFRKYPLPSSMENRLFLESILKNDWCKDQKDSSTMYFLIRDLDGKTVERKECWVMPCKGLLKHDEPGGTIVSKRKRNFEDASTLGWDIANSTLFVPSEETRLLMEIRHGCCPAVSEAFTDPSDFLSCNEGSAAESYFQV
ncbi:predicted protein [Sclerotinia sclerotiorum 1980 UF-70]|uniref:Uncharacterized protein n=2 Tax=Sclerotinia sclerotiorum (strain ATCC 18683 / 1980 / Ss-1) TaxID=665079 RepID=A7EWF9_SCLS1|nr:predicted protein [Sclerotinia sclerotiorum 1980 UF-70]APA05275.1 hypothetical protein sscle_01g000450 [Sclerotinia sclerotiorum 1980 UF-70]EDN93801.1 predicted protein [Sclerotinia sclerotiorum 1980 UF-70]